MTQSVTRSSYPVPQPGTTRTKVRDLLAQKGDVTWTIGPKQSVHDALRLMSERSIGALPVVDEERLVGIISERDYARKIALKGRSSQTTPVADIMTAAPRYVSPDAAVEECLTIMTNDRIRHLPVVEGGRLLGIVSIGDLVRVVIEKQAQALDELNRYVSG